MSSIWMMMHHANTFEKPRQRTDICNSRTILENVQLGKVPRVRECRFTKPSSRGLVASKARLLPVPQLHVYNTLIGVVTPHLWVGTSVRGK